MIAVHSNSPIDSLSKPQHKSVSVKNLSINSFDVESTNRIWFKDLLWRAFPAQSDAARAEKACKVLDCSKRQVINWLNCDNDPKLRYVLKTLAVAGAEIVFHRSQGDN
jgi:hypothetical protein